MKNMTKNGRQSVKGGGVLDQLSNSIYALVSHLYQYVDILRQASARPNSK